jgi:ABC-2 type transport system permease protein
MLRQIWSITKKDLRLWAQKPGEWAVLFLTPFLFITIMGQIFGRSSTPTIAIYAVVEDSGARGKQVISLLQDAKNLSVEILPSRAEADRRVGSGQRMAALVVPAGFTEAVLTPDGGQIALIVDPARQEQASIVIGLVNAALGPLRMDAEVTRGVGQSVDSAMRNYNAGGTAATLGRFLKTALRAVVAEQVQESINNPLVAVQVQSAQESAAIRRPPTLMESLVPGYIIMFAFFLVSTIAVSVVEERALGTFRRLLSTPAPRSAILLGKMLPYLVIVVVQALVLLGISSLVFGVSLGKSPVALALITVASAASVVGLGIMVAAVVRSEGQAGGLTLLLVLVMAAVSGSLFPLIRIPYLQYATPHYWAIQGFQNVISRGLGVSGVVFESGILLGLAAIFFVIGASRFKFD